MFLTDTNFWGTNDYYESCSSYFIWNTTWRARIETHLTARSVHLVLQQNREVEAPVRMHLFHVYLIRPCSYGRFNCPSTAILIEESYGRKQVAFVSVRIKLRTRLLRLSDDEIQYSY